MNRKTGVGGAWVTAAVGFVAIVGMGGCAARQQARHEATGGECPVALRHAQVVAEQRPQDVLVRVTAGPGGDPAAIASRSEQIAEALSGHAPRSMTAAAPSAGAGREVLISRLANGVELAFSTTEIVGMEVLRRRVADRVMRWQNGDCPSLEPGSQTTTGVAQLQTPGATNVLSLHNP